MKRVAHRAVTIGHVRPPLIVVIEMQRPIKTSTIRVDVPIKMEGGLLQRKYFKQIWQKWS